MALLRLGFFGAALLFSLGEMGLLTQALNGYVAFLLAAGVLSVSLPENLRVIPLKRLAAGLLCFIAAALLARGSAPWRFLAFTTFASALVVILERHDPRRTEIAVLVPTTVIFMLYYLAVRYVPHAWWFINGLSLGFSAVAGGAIGQAYAFGATAGGFHVLAFISAWGLARLIWAAAGRWWHYLVFVGLLAITAGAVEMLLTPLAIAVQLWIPWLDFLLFNAQVLYLAAALPAAAWYLRKTMPENVRLALRGNARCIPVALAAGVLLGLGLGLMSFQNPGGGKVLLADKGYLDWRVPQYGRYGGRSGGMFGRLPQFLEAQGYEVARISGLITGESLSGAQALVIINLMDPLEPEEKHAVWQWVSAGGSLLVLGDHTGVMGIREPFNDLLKPVGIEFEFDSATCWGETWRDALDLLPHPVTGGVTVAEDIQIWIGASLTCTPAAKPVIAAKYGYSDIGDEQNAERSFLGDRRHNPGERIGDLCLVAEARHGRGRVLVFGDTSSIQNGALVTSWAFVRRMFAWLTSPPESPVTAIRLAGAAAGVALLVLAWKASKRFAACWSLLALGLVAAMEITGGLAAPPAPPGIGGSKAVIDLSHGERFDQLTWYDDCLGGLELNLMRNGYMPLLMREFSVPLVMDSELLLLIAPARAFSDAEIEVLTEFAEGGGVLIVSTGYEEKDGSVGLLSDFGVKIQNVPLAHYETEVFGEAVHFAEAWPLKVTDPAAIRISGYPGYRDPVVVFVPKGEGGALIVGDSQFLLNANLEGRHEWYLGNIMFLRELLERIRTGGLMG
jgi:hypothetical protein